MSDTSGSWPSGCPEKYPWIGGNEPYEQFSMEWADYSGEQELEQVQCGNKKNNLVTPAEEDCATNRENPLIRQMVELNRDLTEGNRNLTERLHEVEERNLDLTKCNRDLTERNRQMGELLLAFVKK